MGNNLLLIGGGGHCRSVLDTILSSYNFDRIGIVECELGDFPPVFGVSVVGFDPSLPKLFEAGWTKAFITVGSLTDTSTRRRIAIQLRKIGFQLPIIIDKTAIVSKHSDIGRGTFIGKGVIINAGVKIGENVIINTGAVIEHDCKIDDFAHIAGKTVLSGRVEVGHDSFIGAGSSVRQEVRISNNANIGMGSNVLHNVSEGVLAFGNPCKVIKPRQEKKAYIIAEAGVNHNGDINLAYKLIDAAKAAGVDCVKFQTLKAEQLVSKIAKKAEYQQKAVGGDDSQLAMLKKLQLSFVDFENLAKYCRHIGIAFMSTPFDLDSVEFLSTLDMPFWKIPSGEVTNYPYLVKIARTHKPVIMSTGMCGMDEIGNAIDVLQRNGCGDIKLLHCNTEYPTPFCDVNLRAMETMRRVFDMEVGYSDHTCGIEVPIAAVAMGATIIEKHFTLDRNMEGPDHKASLEPDELKQMVDAIRNIEQAMGDGKKMVTASECKNIAIARKSIIAKRDIKAGESFTEENITTKRPGNGISPMRWNEVLGMKAKRDFVEDELIEI